MTVSAFYKLLRIIFADVEGQVERMVVALANSQKAHAVPLMAKCIFFKQECQKFNFLVSSGWCLWGSRTVNWNL